MIWSEALTNYGLEKNTSGRIKVTEKQLLDIVKWVDIIKFAVDPQCSRNKIQDS